MPDTTTIYRAPDTSTATMDLNTAITITAKPQSTNPKANLLSLPLELRLQIYTPLLTPHSFPPAAPIPTPMPISPLFIRAHYKTLFLSQHPHKNITTPLLLVSRQVTAECLPLLYSLPLWRASCRLEQLASQIGAVNFGFIRHLEVDPDDLGAVLGSLRGEVEERAARGDGKVDGGGLARKLRFGNLERLLVNGYQTLAPTSRGSRASRLEARALCFMAIGILSTHPILSVLVQLGAQGHEDPQADGDGNADASTSTGTGGADARDLSFGRVKWRFLRHAGHMEEGEHVVNLVERVALFESLIGMDEVDGGEGDGTMKCWRDGKFVLYPYLR